MHSWGDGFQYFSEVGQAADEIGNFCRRWGRINVTTTKEKWGTARVYCGFSFSLLTLLKPGYVYYPQYWPKWLVHVDIFWVQGRTGRAFGRLLFPYQGAIYRLAYKRALKKYPMIREEILSGADYPEFLEGL